VQGLRWPTGRNLLIKMNRQEYHTEDGDMVHTRNLEPAAVVSGRVSCTRQC
jgi:hypothetical protein